MGIIYLLARSTNFTTAHCTHCRDHLVKKTYREPTNMDGYIDQYMNRDSCD